MNRNLILTCTLITLVLPQVSFAQSLSLNSIGAISLIVIIALLLVAVVVGLTSNVLALNVSQQGAVSSQVGGTSAFPSFIGMPTRSATVKMSGKKVSSFRKGYNIKLKGAASVEALSDLHVTRYAIQPLNFRSIFPIPRMEVKVGDRVLAGEPLFHDKDNENVKFCAPVSGEIIEINRGAKRSISEVVILADRNIEYVEIDPSQALAGNREDLVTFLCHHGAWPLLNQRPFDIIPDTTDVPRDIFISAFNTGPLALDPTIALRDKNNDAAFIKGIETLKRLTSGQVYIGANGAQEAPSVFEKLDDAVIKYYKGPHPIGNVGVQIHHTAPINAGENVWTVKLQDVITLGRLFTERVFDASRYIAVVGSQLKEPKLIRTYQGANVGDLIKNNLVTDDVRFISGDVLTGSKKSVDNYLDFSADQLTVIAEGDHYELFGWLKPFVSRPSLSHTYPNYLFPNQKYTGETNTHGEKRAFVVTGQYERLLPMNIHVQALMKSILNNDIEKMEGLGILELSEEDVALCEFACTSKQPLQTILRQGLDIVRTQ